MTQNFTLKEQNWNSLISWLHILWRVNRSNSLLIRYSLSGWRNYIHSSRVNAARHLVEWLEPIPLVQWLVLQPSTEMFLSRSFVRLLPELPSVVTRTSIQATKHYIVDILSRSRPRFAQQSCLAFCHPYLHFWEVRGFTLKSLPDVVFLAWIFLLVLWFLETC